MASIYGKFQIRLLQDARDNLGVRRVVLAQSFRQDFSARDFGAPPLPDFARNLGIPVTGSDSSPISPGILQVKWTLEGHNPKTDARTPIKTRETTDELECVTGFAERPLTTLPEWDQLRRAQGLSIDPATGRIKWPEIAPGKAPAGGFTTGETPTAPSPWYGLQTWRDITCVLTADYIVRTRSEITAVFPFSKIDVPTKSIDRRLFEGIADRIAIALSSLRDKATTREWRLLPPAFRKRGNVYQIREAYELSPPGGWIRATTR